MPRAGLNPARVTEVALAIVDRDGWESLSLAAVANHAGVKLPSLYKHVDGLPALRRAVAGAATAQLADTMAKAVMGKSGADATRALAAAYRDFARSFPGRYAATVAAPAESDEVHIAAATAAVDAVMAAVTGYGLSDEAAIHAIRALRAMLHGFVSLEAGGGFGMPQSVDESFALLLDDLDQTLERRAAG